MQAKFFKTALLVSVSAGLLSSCDSNNQTPPAERYEYKYNGSVVLDKETKLEWMRCSLGEVWNQAESLCEGKNETIKYEYIEGVAPVINRGQSDINVAGLTDWRMPSIEELRSLRYCSKLTPNEIAYLEEEENKDLKEALRDYADLRIRNIGRANDEIKEIEAEREEIISENKADIEAYKKQLADLDKKLENDIKNLKAETQAQKDAAASAVTTLQLLMQKEKDELEANIAEVDDLLEKNVAAQAEERAKHKDIIAAVESEFKDKVKLIRKLKSDLKDAKAQRTTSDIVDKKTELDAVKGVIAFYEKVYDKKEGDISLITEEVKRKNELTEFLNKHAAEKAKIISELEREIASQTNAEIEKMFASETSLRSLKRDYYKNELSLGAKKSGIINDYNSQRVLRDEELRVAKLDREGRLAAAVELQKAQILLELEITEDTIVRTKEDALKDIKEQNHIIRKINIEVDNFLDIIELSSLDDLDQFLAGDNITQIEGMDALESEVLTDFSVYVTRVALLNGTFPGENDVVREPCGYLSRSPIRTYDNAPEKENLITGIWMLDKVAFPTPVVKTGNKTKLADGNFYWSDSSLSYDNLYTWGVNFRDGRSSTNPVGFSGRIRLVRDAD
ncbi:DUF1566 domain-containing protein [Marinicellulosiphila megalodicopiae]|uniref:Lcl domain-containing protein n=1 Tax=Marinicellulosiphila megalodicopiae TaxID=2724896 RepID=UPI003BAED00E